MTHVTAYLIATFSCDSCGGIHTQITGRHLRNIPGLPARLVNKLKTGIAAEHALCNRKKSSLYMLWNSSVENTME